VVTFRDCLGRVDGIEILCLGKRIKYPKRVYIKFASSKKGPKFVFFSRNMNSINLFLVP